MCSPFEETKTGNDSEVIYTKDTMALLIGELLREEEKFSYLEDEAPIWIREWGYFRIKNMSRLKIFCLGNTKKTIVLLASIKCGC